MTQGLFQKYGKYIGTSVIGALLSVSMLSVVNLGMHMPTEVQVGDCPFSGAVHSMCALGPFAHISLWQGLSTAVIPQLVISLLALFAVLFVSAYAAAFFSRSFYFSPPCFAGQRVRSRTLPPTPLQEAFSRGILNPKLF